MYECAPPAQPVDRFLVSPVRRQALITGRLVQLAIVSVIQSLIVIALGLLVGARFPGGVTGLAVLMACSALLGASLPCVRGSSGGGAATPAGVDGRAPGGR